MAFSKTFKPDAGSSERYTLTNLKSGEKVKVRVLTEWIDGLQVWSDTDDGKRLPFRVRPGVNIPVGKIGFNKLTGKDEQIKQFIAGTVYNYTTERLEILSIDKRSIINQIYELEESEDWGDAREYDITISKKGTGMDTEYGVLPSNKAKFTKMVDLTTVNLEALYDGSDPFNTSGVMPTDDAPAPVVDDEDIVTEVNPDDVPF